MSHGTQTLTPRQRRREATIESILAAAMEMLLADGFDGLTIGKLAAELDYTKGALYRYFGSKDALIAELQVRSLRRLHDRYQALWERLSTSLAGLTDGQRALGLLYASAMDYVRVAEELPADFALIRVAVGDPRHLLPETEVGAVMETMLALLSDVGRLLSDAEAAGALREGDGVRRAINLWAAIHGNVLTRKFARFGPQLFAPAALISELTRTMLLGWGATLADVDAATQAVREATP